MSEHITNYLDQHQRRIRNLVLQDIARVAGYGALRYATDWWTSNTNPMSKNSNGKSKSNGNKNTVARPPRQGPRNNRVNRGNIVLSRGGAKPMNRILAPVSGSNIVRRMPSGLDNMVFAHSELIASVYGSVGYTAGAIPINPALPQSFPWLSQLAALWDMYNVIGIIFRYIPGCSTATSGTVSIGFDYDAYDGKPADKNSFMMLQDSCTSPAWAECAINLNRQSLSRRKNLYNRTGAIPGDLKTYDLGNLMYATQGQASAGTYLGDIYVDYVIRMSMPQQVAPVIQSFLLATSFTGQTAARPFGTDVVGYEQAESPPGFLTVATNNVYKFQRSGSFKIDYYVTGTVLGLAAGDVSLEDTATYPDDTISTIYTSLNAAGTVAMLSYHVKVSDLQGLKIKYTTFTTLTEVQFYVLPVQGGLSY